jgi:ABC-2 type transport system ATP-binding protein
VRNKLCQHLSRGFRQRAGIAQAIIHDPEVVILDEPTSGLDPKQIIEIRQTISSLAENHTVILSTHILPEVSMVCSKVVIINRGRVVLEQELSELIKNRPLEQVFIESVSADEIAA